LASSFFRSAASPHPNLSAAWQICGKFLALAFFAEPRSATLPSPLCRNENLRNRLCRQFAARLPHAVNVRRGRIPATRLKPFAWFGILLSTTATLARRVVADATQVPVMTLDFACDLRAVAFMRLKRFQSYAFSYQSRAARARTAFGLPQRA
jgi:hypothetical protein